MKIAICKGFTNISFSKNNKSAASADIEYFINQLGNSIDIDIVSGKTSNTVIPNELGFVELKTVDFNQYNLIVLFNFNINFFGGAENESGIELYKALSRSDTKIAYIQTDCRLPFQKLWPLIQGKPWAEKYKESDFYIDENRITYITQGSDLEKVKTTLSKKNLYSFANMYHYPIAETILAKYEIPSRLIDERIWDLGFGGATRDAHKVKKVKKYFTNPKFKNYVFGGIKLDGVDVHPKVSYQEMISTMMSCKGTVIVGDKHYEDNYFTLRIYESILAGCLTYIDYDFDTKQKFYQGKYPELYIKSTDDIIHLNNIELAKDANDFILTSYNFKNSQEKLVSLLKFIDK
jgi:hypothetical protein